MYNCQSYMVQVVLHTDAKTQSKEGGGGGGGIGSYSSWVFVFCIWVLFCGYPQVYKEFRGLMIIYW